MTFPQFLEALTREVFVFRMARGLTDRRGPQGLGAQKRMDAAQKAIDVLVLKRAEAIRAEVNDGREDSA